MQADIWRIEMMGGLRLTRGEHIVTRFRTTNVARLLARLACFPQRQHMREELMDWLCPDAETEVARCRLRQEIATLRRILEPPDVEARTVLCANRVSIQLREGAFTTDAGEFERLLTRARDNRTEAGIQLRNTAGQRSQKARAESLAQAVARYRGELLPGFYDDWVLAERDRLATLHLRALRELAACHVQENENEQAIVVLLRAAAVAPQQEEPIADLVRLLLSAGQPQEAVRQFRQWAARANARADLPPSRELCDLVAECVKQVQQPAPLPLSPAQPVRAPRILPVNSSDPTAEARLTLTLTGYYERSGEWLSSRQALERVLAETPSLTADERIGLHTQAGNLAHRLGDFAGARAHLVSALALCHREQRRETAASVLLYCGVIALVEDDHARAETSLRASRACWRRLGDALSAAWTEYHLGALALHRGQYAHAEALLHSAMQAAVERNRSDSIANFVGEQGVLALCRDDYETAATRCDEAYRRFEADGHRPNTAWAQSKLALARQAQGCSDEAKFLLESALTTYRDVGDLRHVAYISHDLGRLALAQGAYDDACHHLDEALVVSRQTGQRRGLALATGTRAQLAMIGGDSARAATLAAESRELRCLLGDPLLLADAQEIQVAHPSHKT